MELNKEKIDLIRKYPFFKETLSLLRKILSFSGLDETSLEDVLYLGFPEDMIILLKREKDGEVIQKIAKRKEGFVFYCEHNQFFEYNDKNQVDEIQKVLMENIEDESQVKNREISNLKGFSGFNGKVTGKVRKIFKLEELKKIEQGDILVCRMATPEYSTVLNKVGGVIADEGSLLSHVSVLAREFKKPFVYNTKIATSLLKEGQIVEIDGENVRIIA